MQQCTIVASNHDIRLTTAVLLLSFSAQVLNASLNGLQLQYEFLQMFILKANLIQKWMSFFFCQFSQLIKITQNLNVNQIHILN